MKKILTLCLFVFLLLSFGKSRAQIVYDSLHDPLYWSSIRDIDLNDDGNLDYIVNGRSDTAHYIRILTNDFSQVLVDTMTTLGLSLPKVLKAGDSICSSQNVWQTPQNPTWFYLVNRGVHNFGLWWGQADKYVAVRINKGGDWYYGWLHLTITTDTSSTAQNILFSKAYNSQPGQCIMAGQRPVSDINETNLNEHIYSVNKNIIVDSKENIQGTIIVCNSLGQTVYSNYASGSHVEINLGNFDSGIYFVTISSDKNTFSKKLLIK